jgi:hypothetical protein
MQATAMKLLVVASLLGFAPAAAACGCEAVDKYLIGKYHGDCDEQTERAQGEGNAEGADRYVGRFEQGRPDGKGVYTWENGARLEGLFRDGKAHGAGVYVSAGGARYRGEFVAGLLRTVKAADCPATPGPVTCTESTQ